jgi:hypothetical protein
VRVCLVTPFAWSQPHDVNEHVAGVARGLRALDHEVTILAPSTRAAELLAGRRALQRHGPPPEVIAVGPAVPISRRSQMGVPVGVRANLALAHAQGRYDLVHGFEPGLPSLSYLALRETEALTVATFASPERLSYPPARSQREKLLTRLDALVALSETARGAAAERFPGEYQTLSPGVDLGLFAPKPKRRQIVVEVRPNERQLARGVVRMLRELPGWDVLLLRAAPLVGRPTIPRDLVGLVHIRTARDGAARAPLLREAAVFVPGIDGLDRVLLEAKAAGCAIAAPSGLASQPELAAAAAARLAEDDAFREAEQQFSRDEASSQSFSDVAAQLDELYREVASRRKPRRRLADPLADRPWIVADLHMHTNWSFDCAIDPAELVDHAEAEGLGAIAVTDHNVFGGALETVDAARDRDLVVIPGEEVKTDEQGEVIGLFLEREIPRGLPFADTIAAIREQGGRPHAHRARPADPPPPPRRHRRARGLQRAAPVRRAERRGAAVRAQVRPDDGRRLGRTRAPGCRHRGATHARVPGPGGVSHFAPQRRDPPAAEVARLPPEPQVDGPGQGKGPLEPKDHIPPWPP